MAGKQNQVESLGNWGVPQTTSDKIPEAYRAAVFKLSRGIDLALRDPSIVFEPQSSGEALAALSRTDPMPEGMVERVQGAVARVLAEESSSTSPDEPLV